MERCFFGDPTEQAKFQEVSHETRPDGAEVVQVANGNLHGTVIYRRPSDRAIGAFRSTMAEILNGVVDRELESKLNNTNGVA